MAVKANHPIVPVICSPVRDLFHDDTHTITPGTIHIKVLDPIFPEGRTVAELLNITRDKMLEGLATLKTDIK